MRRRTDRRGVRPHFLCAPGPNAATSRSMIAGLWFDKGVLVETTAKLLPQQRGHLQAQYDGPDRRNKMFLEPWTLDTNGHFFQREVVESRKFRPIPTVHPSPCYSNTFSSYRACAEYDAASIHELNRLATCKASDTPRSCRKCINRGWQSQMESAFGTVDISPCR